MTIEELRRKSREIRELQSNEGTIQDLDTSVSNDVYSSLSSIDKLRLQSRANNAYIQANDIGNSDYSNALVKAEEEGNWISQEYDRNKLVDYAKQYSSQMEKSYSEGNMEDYYKNQVLFDKVQNQAKGLGLLGEDILSEVDVNAKNAMADMWLAGQKIHNNIWVNVSKDELKKIYNNNGSPVDTEASYKTLSSLRALKGEYPDDKYIQRLYETVVEQKYDAGSDPDSFFDSFSKYATEKLKESKYYGSLVYERTRDEKADLEYLKNRENMTDYDGFGNAVLSGVGTVGYMVPSLLIGYATGGAGELAGASASAVGNLNQLGTLGSMYLSSSGNAFDRTLAEGYGWNKSDSYSKAIGTLEVVSEVIGGESVMAGIGGFASHTLTSKVAQKLIAKGKTPLAKWMIGIAWDVGAEALEEVFSSAVEPIISRNLLDKKVTVEEYWLGILESARDSLIPTLILGGFGKGRIVNTVSNISNALHTKLDVLMAQGGLTEQEYLKMYNDLKSWTDDAMAGVTERYEKIKNELGTIEYTNDYNNAMQQMNTDLDQRGAIVQYANSLAKIPDMTDEQKQANIEKYAKNFGYDSEKLAQVFSSTKDVLPFTYKQAENTVNKTLPANQNVKNIINNINQNATNAQVKKATIEGIGNLINQKTETNQTPQKIKVEGNKLFVKLAKKSPAERTASGVIRLDVNDKAPVQSFNLGVTDNKNKPTYQEIMDSPILLQEYQTPDGATERSVAEMKQYVYNNFADFEKDMLNKYGTLSSGLIKAITMSGKGGYEMKVTNNGDIVWERNGITIKKKGRKPLNKSQNTKQMATKDKKSSMHEDAQPREALNRNVSYDAKPTKEKETVTKKDGFYSQAEKVIVDKMANKTDSQTIKNLMLKNGVKQDEMNWLDMDEFLASKDTFTREEVLDYIRANQLDIEEVRKDDAEKMMVLEEMDRLNSEEDRLRREARSIAEKYEIFTFNGEIFDRITNLIINDKDLSELVELEKFDLREDGNYYYDANDSSYFTLEEMRKDMEHLRELYDEYQDIEAQLGELPEVNYGYGDDFNTSPKYRKYSTNLGGRGKNYREVLFTLPDSSTSVDAMSKNKKLKNESYQSPHWGEPNVLAHTRLQDYEDDAGNDVLFIEEVQSDLHQDGRKYGYTSDERQAKLEDNLDKATEEWKTAIRKLESLKEYKDAHEIENEIINLKQKRLDIVDEFNEKYNNIPPFNYTNLWTEIYSIMFDYSEEEIIRTAKRMEELEHRTSEEALKMVREYVEKFETVNGISKRIDKLNTEFFARERAYKRTETYQAVEEARKNMDQASLELGNYKYDAVSGNFPFKKTWHEFVLRKIINEAVAEGYDKVAWTTGKQQNDRYNLAKYVKQIDYDQNSDGTYNAHTFNKDGGRQLSFYNKNEKELEDIFGKEMTRKIISGEYDVKANYNYGDSKSRIGRIEGVDLEIGGEGMRGFYDKIIPEYLNKYLKKWNSKVEDVVIDGHHQMGFEITQEMIDSVEDEGQPLFETKDVEKSKKPLYNQGRGDLNGKEQARTNKSLNRNKNESRSDRQGTTDVQHRGIESKSNINDKYISSNKDVSNGIQNTEHDNELEKSSKQRKSIDKATVEKAFNEIIKKYGTTTEYKNAGYLLPDGKMINLTDRATGKRIPHSDIRTTGLDEVDYIYSGAIRLLPELGLWSMSENPTQEQFDFLEKYIDKYIHGSLKLPPGFENIDTFIDIYTQNGEIKSFEIPRDEDGSNAIRSLKKYLNSIKENSNQGSFFDAKSRPLNKNTRKATNTELKELADNISNMYRESAMEQKESPIFTRTDAINRGDIPREEGRAERSLNEIAGDIKKFLKGKYAKLKGNGRSYGTFSQNSGWIRTGELSNIDTQFHELGHYIQYELLNKLEEKPVENSDEKTVKKEYKEYKFSKEVVEELKKLSDARWNYKGKKRISEGFAEAVRLWTVDRINFIDEYKNISKMFVENMEKTKELQEVFKFLDKMQDKIIDYENMTPAQKAKALRKLATAKANVDSPIHQLGTQIFKHVFNDAIYANKFDRYVAKQLNKNYNDLLHIDRIESALRLSGNGQTIAYQLNNGIVDFDTGKKITHGIGEVTESVKPSKAQAKELGMKVNDLWAENIYDVGLYAQLKRMDYLYKSGRKVKNLGMRASELEDAINGIVEDSHLTREQLEYASNLINEDSQALINYAYDQGLINAEQRDSLLENNMFYAPLNRIQENDGNGGLSKFGNKAFYHLGGSDMQLEEPFVSLASNWGRLIRIIDENNVYKKFGDLAKRIKDAGGDYGLWFDLNVPPERIHKGEASLADFEKTLRQQFVDIENSTGLDLLGGDIVKLMDLDATVSLFAPAYINKAERIISYKENGKTKYMQFADNDWGRGLFRLMAGLDTSNQNKILDFLQELNAPLKMGATGMNIEFALGNMQSDAMMRYITSDANFINRVYVPVITNVYNAVRYMVHRGEFLPGWSPKEASNMYKKFVQSGVVLSGKFKSNLENIRGEREQIFGDASKAVFKNVEKRKGLRKPSEVITQSKVGQVLSWIPEISEQATRFAEFSAVYKKMKEDGASESVAIKEAGMKARLVTQDFTVQGQTMRYINKVVPFASATVGSLYRMGQEARNHPGRFTARMAGLGAMALFISSLIKGKDRDWYDELNEQKKYDNFILPNPFGDSRHPMIIKKPQGPVRAFVNLVQFMYDVEAGYIKEDELKDKFVDWLVKSIKEVNFADDGVLDFIPSAVQGFAENMLNYDFYYGTPIVSQDLQKLDPRHQYDEYTHELSKFIGNIFNWSPKKIDNIMTKWFAGLGKQINGAIDDAVRVAKGTGNQLPAKDISEKTFASRAFANVLKNPTSVNKIYERSEYLEREKAEGRMTHDELQEYERLQTAKDILSKYNKQIKSIRNDSSLSAEQKKDRIDDLQELRIDTARYYLGKTALDDSNIKTIEKVEFYPANDTYSYTVNKKKYELSFADEATKNEYAELFKKEYEKELKELHNSANYKKATDEEKYELEKDAKKKARTSATNKMKPIVYKRTYLNK